MASGNPCRRASPGVHFPELCIVAAAKTNWRGGAVACTRSTAGGVLRELGPEIEVSLRENRCLEARQG